jgi:hypothetical protein
MALLFAPKSSSLKNEMALDCSAPPSNQMLPKAIFSKPQIFVVFVLGYTLPRPHVALYSRIATADLAAPCLLYARCPHRPASPAAHLPHAERDVAHVGDNLSERSTAMSLRHHTSPL